MEYITMLFLLLLCKDSTKVDGTTSVAVTPKDNQLNCPYVCVPASVTALGEGSRADVYVNVSCTDKEGMLEFNITVEDSNIAEIVGRRSFISDASRDFTHLNFTVRGKQFGRTTFHIYSSITVDQNGTDVLVSEERKSKYAYSVAVVRKPNKAMNILFTYLLGVLIVLIYFTSGCKIRPSVIKGILKTPVAPLIGFCCQFLIMAPLSFGVAYFLRMDHVTGMGLLTIGSSPGGGGSNIFAILLDADLELSITMTFFSSLAALGMTPFWLWLLGSKLGGVSVGRFTIPVQNVFMSLTLAVIPVVAGVVFAHYMEYLADKLTKYLKPIVFVSAITFLGFALWMFWYILPRITWKTVVACLLVPNLGYLCGALAAFMLHQDRTRIVAIMLETGFQNLSLAIFMLRISFPVPEVDLASIIPVYYMLFGCAFPLIWFFFREGKRFYRRWKDRQSKENETECLNANHTSGYLLFSTSVPPRE